MDSNRIKEIQLQTAYPDSISVQQALLAVWNECEQETQNSASLTTNKVSSWEHKLVGKNIHSVVTWCKDCHMEGCNIHFEDECGNCGSKNTVRYYDKETIDLLFS